MYLMMSRWMMLLGTCQYGLKLIWWILLARIGVCRSTRPTIAVWRSDDHAALDRLDRGRRDVDDDVAALGQVGREGVDALGVEVELVEPDVGRDRERVVGRLVDLAVDDEAVARLEAADAGVGRLVEGAVRALLDRHVAGPHQAALEGDDAAAYPARGSAL